MKRKYSLDVLKCIATVLIIFHHYQQMTGVYFEGFINFYKGSFYWGNLVELFFILSGYVSYKYVSDIDVTSSFWEFFFKKYLRFIPMIIICGVGSIIITTIRDGKIIFNLGAIIPSLLGIMRWLNMKGMVNNPTWYISVLLLCYVLLFFVTYIAKKMRINPYTMYVLMIALGMLMVSHYDKTGIDYPFWSKAIGRGYYTFFWGIILRKILETTKIKEKFSSILWCGMGILAFSYLFIKHNGFINKEQWYLLSFVVFPAIIILFEHDCFDKRMMLSKHLKALGGISFNAFMWHVNLINIFKIAANYLSIKFERVSVMVFITFVIFVFGYLSYRFIETPINKQVNKKLLAQLASNAK